MTPSEDDDAGAIGCQLWKGTISGFAAMGQQWQWAKRCMLQSSVVVCILMAGCATVPREVPVVIAPHAPATAFTHGASAERTPQYFRCVSKEALLMTHAPASPQAIARFAAQRCDALRQAITQALEEENADKPLAQNYAQVFGEALEARVIHHVAEEVRVARRNR